MAIRPLSNAQHCTGREAGYPPGPVLRPWRGAQALRLAGKRIATPACALVRNDRLESTLRSDWVRSFRKAGGGGQTAALHCALKFTLQCIGGALPVKYDNL